RAECVGALILGRPRPLSGHRRAGPPRDVRYTLIWEEPGNGVPAAPAQDTPGAPPKDDPARQPEADAGHGTASTGDDKGTGPEPSASEHH
ncbi:hypothetical protein, partial [Propionibacterium freudenreichii]|uniref:hypothetical protein n=1 Tax=Propionibacterium freudenreichii TaxID=1744 RepID=UPI001C642DA8